MLSMVLCMGGLAGQASADANNFWEQWSDGKAEVNAFRIEQKRYNELRTGTMFLIYVTEPFSISRQVKVDYYDATNPDHTIALKLNIIEQFQTGMYDYRLMRSHFFDARNHLRPLKSVYSSQEWCGTTYEQINWLPQHAKLKIESYFEGASIETKLPVDMRLTDALLVYGRGLLRGGPTRSPGFVTKWVESAKQRQLSHRTTQTYPANPRFKGEQTVDTPLGKFTTRTLVFKRASGAQCTVHIQTRAPYRVTGWRCTDGETATLLGSVRTDYWSKTKPNDELLLKQLGVHR